MQNHNPGLSISKPTALTTVLLGKEILGDLLAFLSLLFLPLRQANGDSKNLMEICSQIIIFKTGHELNWAGKEEDGALHTQPDSLS